MEIPSRLAHYIFAAVFGCSLVFPADGQDVDFRQEMREFVQSLSAYAKGLSEDFIIIPQNGQDLLTDAGDSEGTLVASYVQAIDGIGREDVLYGYDSDDVATPPAETEFFQGFLDLAESNGLEVLVTDYCSTQSFVEDSYARNLARGYVSFAADDRELRTIPTFPEFPTNVNGLDIETLSDAENFLYLLNPEQFSSREEYLDALGATNFDLLLVDLFAFEQQDGTQLAPAEVEALKVKQNGGSRLVIAYVSIGEAGDFRYYWLPSFNSDPPPWLEAENPNFEGNFVVRYWMEDWQDIIFGNATSYIAKIVDAGFDGAYLDIIDAFEFFEDQAEGDGTGGCAAGALDDPFGANVLGDLLVLVTLFALLLVIDKRASTRGGTTEPNAPPSSPKLTSAHPRQPAAS